MSQSTTPPHPTSIAVWDVPSPVVVNGSFTVKVRTKCSLACQLTGQLIVVRDEAGIQAGEGRLGDTPWPGTSVLYGAQVHLAAPAGEGMYTWAVTFAGTESEMPHEDASATFSFRTTRPQGHGDGPGPFLTGVEYCRYAPSSRLAGRAPRHPWCLTVTNTSI